MDRQPPSDLPVLNWGDSQIYRLVPESETANITSLLSARSYLLPESYTSPNGQRSTPSSLSPGDLTLELASSSNQTSINQTPLLQPMTPRPQTRQRWGPKEAGPAKDDRGVPRAVSDSKGHPKERRRMQSRIAQRAYRARQQAIVEGLKNRISHLETSMEKMSSAMLSFSEELVRSGVLRGHSALTTNLRDTMKVFLAMASGVVSLDDEKMGVVLVDSDKITESPPGASQQQEQRRLKWLPRNIPRHLPLDGTQLTSAIPPHTANSAGMAIIEVSEFIQQLLLVVLYQGHLALGDTSIGLDQLQRPFGLIFSMMNREQLKSYFKAELDSQLSQKPLDGWDEVPFFRLGGAGTHYADGKSTGPFVAHYQSGGTVEDPLSLVGADLRTQLEGDWFDLQDLEGYIRDKNVLLVTAAGERANRSKVQTSINVSRFITALITRGVCLGRTPGFQRKDVEYALCVAKVG